jgi:hypothetical protein
VQRAVDPDNDGNYTWQTVAGDYWGAAGEFPFTGEYQERYRLIIKNQQTGDQRELGTHIPTSDGVKNIIVGNIIFDAENATGTFWDADINRNTSNLQILYTDPTNSTKDLTIKVYERGNESNTLYNKTFAGPLGTETIAIHLTSDQEDMNWVVEFQGSSGSGPVFGKVPVGGSAYLLPIDPTILRSFALVFVTFIMALYGPRTAVMGAWAGVLAVSGLMFLGWVNVSVVAVTIAAVIAAGGTFYREAMPG